MTMDELLAEWRMWQLAAGRSMRTVDERERMVKRFAVESGHEAFGATTGQIVDWMGSHSAGGKRSLWSAGTRRSYFNVMRAWFKWLATMEYRVDDPTVKIGAPRVPSYEPHPVSDAHLPRLLSQRMHARTKLMILLAGYAGLRVHEIAKIRGEDVDVIARTLSVRGKGGTLRSLPLSDHLIVASASMPRRGWWFPSHTEDGPIQARSVSTIISNVMRRAGIPGTAHSLRHWFASALVAQGTDLRTVQELLRHASLATTQIYTKVPDGSRRVAVDGLNMLESKPAA